MMTQLASWLNDIALRGWRAELRVFCIRKHSSEEVLYRGYLPDAPVWRFHAVNSKTEDAAFTRSLPGESLYGEGPSPSDAVERVWRMIIAGHPEVPPS